MPRLYLSNGELALRPQITSVVGLIVCCLVMASGCARRTIPALNEGYASLDQKQYDRALASADEFLAAHPSGKGAAEAHYLRGRALEQRQAPNPAAAVRNLQDARRAYTAALGEGPSKSLAGYIHASLSNVAFHLDDFAVALPEAVQAFELIDSPELQSQLLLRVGQCHQRLSRFVEADRTFLDVQQRFPNSSAANAARQMHGQHQFYVQVGTFGQAGNAESAIKALSGHKVPLEKGTHANGRTIVRMGPFASYPEARQTRERFIQSFPDSIITP